MSKSITLGYYDWTDFNNYVIDHIVLDLNTSGRFTIKDLALSHSKSSLFRRTDYFEYVYLNAPYSCFIGIQDLVKLVFPPPSDPEKRGSMYHLVKDLKGLNKSGQNFTLQSDTAEYLFSRLECILNFLKPKLDPKDSMNWSLRLKDHLIGIPQNNKVEIKGVIMSNKFNDGLNDLTDVLLKEGYNVQRHEGAVLFEKNKMVQAISKDGDYYEVHYQDTPIKSTNPLQLFKDLKNTEFLQDAIDSSDYLKDDEGHIFIINSETAQLFTVMPNGEVYSEPITSTNQVSTFGLSL